MPVTSQQLAELLDRHAAALQLFAAQWTHAADDCVQDAFVQLLRQPALPDNVAAWLFRVVRNRALSTRRAEGRRAKHEQQAARNQPESPFQATPSGVDAEELSRCLERLDEQQRAIVVARIWGELTLEETAEVVGLSRSTVHRRYQEALQTLRDYLGARWTITNPSRT